MTGGEHLINPEVARASLSAIKEMAMRAARVDDVASLSWGLPSFPTPANIRRAVATALDQDPDVGKYALPNGLPELRRLAAAEHFRRTGVEVDPEENVFITAGNMQGMSTLLHVLVAPGDEVVITDPGFASHYEQVRLRGGIPVPWALDEGRGWDLTLDVLPSLLTDRTRALILVNPANPTGSLFGRSQLLELGRLLKDRAVMLILDDPYSDLIYDEPESFYNPASDQGLSEQLTYLFTFSKIHAMSGWRLGYMIMPGWLQAQVLKVHDANMICAPRISQVAGMAALSGSQEHVGNFRRILGTRRELICERLDALPHVFSYVRPKGAYYVFPRIVAPHQDSWSFAAKLLDEAKVSVTPGVAFGPASDHHVRLAFCVSDSEIDRAFDRISSLYPD
jgi:aspartate/methionine/tyrosine aminotransferase